MRRGTTIKIIGFSLLILDLGVLAAILWFYSKVFLCGIVAILFVVVIIAMILVPMRITRYGTTLSLKGE